MQEAAAQQQFRTALLSLVEGDVDDAFRLLDDLLHSPLLQKFHPVRFRGVKFDQTLTNSERHRRLRLVGRSAGVFVGNESFILRRQQEPGEHLF